MKAVIVAVGKERRVFMKKLIKPKKTSKNQCVKLYVTNEGCDCGCW